MRLFVALPLPEDLRLRLQGLQQGLSAARWVKPENLHLTLRFIGEVDGGQAHDIDGALLRVRAEPFTLALRGVGHFGEGRKLRALWAGIAPEPRLGHLQGKIERAVQEAGLAPEGRKFKPHVTLARFNGDANGAAGAPLKAYMAANLGFAAAPFAVDRFLLVSSFRAREGAIYRPEAEYPLGGN